MKKVVLLLSLASLVNVPMLFSEIKVCFSPNGGAKKEIIELIKNSSGSIDVMCYSFNSKDIAKNLLDAHKRGVFVRVILDRSQTKRRGSLNKFLKKNGIDVRLISGIRKGVMHNKVGIFDGKEVVTGSYNWTEEAEHLNHDNALFSDDLDLIDDYKKEFDKLWLNGE